MVTLQFAVTSGKSLINFRFVMDKVGWNDRQELKDDYKMNVKFVII
jgi:hypothetical protein